MTARLILGKARGHRPRLQIPILLSRHCATAAIERDLGGEAGCGSACLLICDERLPDVTLKTVVTVLGILRSDTCSPKYA